MSQCKCQIVYTIMNLAYDIVVRLCLAVKIQTIAYVQCHKDTHSTSVCLPNAHIQHQYTFTMLTFNISIPSQCSHSASVCLHNAHIQYQYTFTMLTFSISMPSQCSHSVSVYLHNAHIQHQYAFTMLTFSISIPSQC